MARRENSEINAGSMADIAFLLLIFFLVTTTMDVDSGISRKLPEKSEDTPEVTIKEKNVLDITVNRNNQILIEGTDFVEVTDIRKIAMDFIDNGGGLSVAKDGKPAEPCDYCQGAKDPASSDHPTKAIISLQSDRGTTYGMYVSIQNEIEAAYNELRNRMALEKYNRTYSDLLKEYNDNGGDSLKEKIDFLKDSYPQIITEPEPIK
ncbi:biopolymer transporter ExbD [Lutibacter sp. A64]|uniref:ExbD/TolR family protein n=1 Tax=Lutibacter sp. A64 TaxID=2918526 RepID=UPI001F069597|nr:biopolymer transporter ExbD [Lutibacter sp. A64]UMB53413.1 biopolymer transporter ExbD [Lutibacter sp. A64]